jgi:acyl-CoA hydrolase
MALKLQVGGIVVLKSTTLNPGKTSIRIKKSDFTQKIKSGDAINFTPYMVLNTLAEDGETANCYYYSSHTDTFADKWFSTKSLKVVTPSRKVKSDFDVGDIVTLKTALAQPAEREVEYKFTLPYLTNNASYSLRKTYGSAYATPPTLTVVAKKEKSKVTIIRCMWLSRKTGRIFEIELPASVLILRSEIKSQLSILRP